MDKIVWVCILMTLLGFMASSGSASTTDFEDALNNIDGKCMTKSVLASNPCSGNKTAVTGAIDGATACTSSIPAYKTCLDTDCDQNTDLDNIKAAIDGICGTSGSGLMSDLVTEITKVDGKCMTKSVPVPTPCNGEKLAVETPFKANDVPGACTNLPAYKTCLDVACDQNTDLDNFIAKMETTCSMDPAQVIKTAVDDVEKGCTDTAQTVNCNAEKQAVDNAGTDPEAVCVLVESYTECMGRKCDDTATFRDAVEAIEALCAEDSKDGNDSGSDFLRPAFLVILLPVVMLNLI